MSSRSKRSTQLKQMEDAVLGLGGGGGIGGSTGLGSSDGLAAAGLSAGGLGGGVVSGGPMKSNVNALADLEREVKLSIGTGDDDGAKSSSSGRRKKGKNELEKSLAEGLSIAPSKDSMASEGTAGTARYADSTLGGNDPLDARDLDEEYVSNGGGGNRGYGSYTGAIGDRCGDCMTWMGRNKRLIGLVSLIAVAIGASVGAAKAAGNAGASAAAEGGGEAAAAVATVKSEPVEPEPEPEPEPEVEEEASSETTTPTTLYPPGASRQEMIRARMIHLGYTDPYDLDEPEGEDDVPSAQYQAVQWLANEDPMQVDPSDPYLPHRYALATFWYATYEDAARYDEENPPSEDGIEYANWDREDLWMSEKGICLWYGVKCWPNSAHDDRFDGNHQVITLNLTSNNIRGYIPDEMWRILTDMRHLDLSDNILTGDLPPEIGGMIHMEDLRLGTNELTGTIPPEIGDMVRLKDLYLESNWMEGPLTTDIGLLTNLRHLGLYKNWFNGTIPFEFESLTNLQSLYLDINEITGGVPDFLLFKLPALMDLRLGQNQLSGPIPEIPPGVDTALKILYLDHNNLYGDIPPSISELRHLEDLHLYKNSLWGPLPTSLGDLGDLDRLFLDHNDLSGPIPPEWAGLDDLEELYLYENDLTGLIPGKVLGGMVDLRQLKIGDNSFFGPVPQELTGMYKLEQIWLETNVLTGTMPDLGDLHKLESLRIHDNGLVGAVPAPTCDLVEYYALEEFSADCAPGDGDAPPKIECECCTSCPVMEEAEVSV